jgi:hypothetical protein
VLSLCAFASSSSRLFLPGYSRLPKAFDVTSEGMLLRSSVSQPCRRCTSLI